MDPTVVLISEVMVALAVMTARLLRRDKFASRLTQAFRVGFIPTCYRAVPAARVRGVGNREGPLGVATASVASRFLVEFKPGISPRLRQVLVGRFWSVPHYLLYKHLKR